MLKVGLVQTRTPAAQGAALAHTAPLVREAAAAGATLIVTPECSNILQRDRAKLFAVLAPEESDAFVTGLSMLAKELSVWLLIGSALVKRDDGRAANRSILVAPDGSVSASYDKIHMFDVDLPNGERYRESAVFRPGERAVTAALPWGVLGMTVCYDLRFAHLYRALAQAGADFLSIPSAFTVPTGRAHWHVLMRARAIETGCFVLAPAQWGEHANGRKTYGHSLVVAPWGEVLAEAADGVGLIVAEIDPVKVLEARRQVPSLSHDRAFAKPPTLKNPLAAE